ncbi:MAG: endonuclease/exonuclease/phosphatase family protein [Bacteroidaceae bacterium]|nr:endonuclease/exonuclease/phosphatase family protein [Bacteroidaceae bacterium]
MKLLKKIPLAIFIAVNLLMIAAMNFCAYTSCLPPQDAPQWSYFGLMFPVFLTANVLFVFFWLIFKWKMVLLPLVGMVLCTSSVRAYFPVNFPSEPPTGSIKVLSYNVEAFGMNKPLEWEENPILKYLMESGADVICLQEAMKAVVDNALDRISVIYPYHYYELETDNYIACFSKFPIESVEKINYPSTTNHSYVYEMLVGEDTLLVVNNHLESYRLSSEDKENYKSIIKNYQHPEQNDSETKYLSLTEKIIGHDSIRGMQVDSVADFVERNRGRYLVLCGDLNATPVSYVHHRLTKVLDDAYTRSGNGPGISYHRSGMYFRIDHILVSPNIKAYGAKVDDSIKDSDHYPIYCFINFE